jgi:hypothetical protein
MGLGPLIKSGRRILQEVSGQFIDPVDITGRFWGRHFHKTTNGLARILFGNSYDEVGIRYAGDGVVPAIAVRDLQVEYFRAYSSEVIPMTLEGAVKRRAAGRQLQAATIPDLGVPAGENDGDVTTGMSMAGQARIGLPPFSIVFLHGLALSRRQVDSIPVIGVWAEDSRMRLTIFSLLAFSALLAAMCVHAAVNPAIYDLIVDVKPDSHSISVTGTWIVPAARIDKGGEGIGTRALSFLSSQKLINLRMVHEGVAVPIECRPADGQLSCRAQFQSPSRHRQCQASHPFRRSTSQRGLRAVRQRPACSYRIPGISAFTRRRYSGYCSGKVSIINRSSTRLLSQ